MSGIAGRRVLVVDDQPDVLDLTETVLSAEGYEVTKASDGLEALERAFDGRFDLVLMDINMPRMDGWEALRLMKADDALRSVPVVMFSVRNEIHNQVQGLQFGAVGYLAKPFAIDELVDKVRDTIGAAHGARGRREPSP